MLTILIGADWVSNRNAVLDMIAKNVSAGIGGQILMVPELISHDTERRLCETAGDTASRFAEVLTFTRLVKRFKIFIICQTAIHRYNRCEPLTGADMLKHRTVQKT